MVDRQRDVVKKIMQVEIEDLREVMEIINANLDVEDPNIIWDKVRRRFANKSKEYVDKLIEAGKMTRKQFKPLLNAK